LLIRVSCAEFCVSDFCCGEGGDGGERDASVFPICADDYKVGGEGFAVEGVVCSEGDGDRVCGGRGAPGQGVLGGGCGGVQPGEVCEGRFGGVLASAGVRAVRHGAQVLHRQQLRHDGDEDHRRQGAPAVPALAVAQLQTPPYRRLGAAAQVRHAHHPQSPVKS
jgi:hypothetical protein